MTHLYVAHVMFPTSALIIPAVDEAYYALPREYRAMNGDVAIVVDRQANYGDIAITNILQRYQIPYDHHHADHHDCQEWTMQARYCEGRCILDSINDAHIAVREFSAKVLQLMEAGDTETALDLLKQAAQQGHDDRPIDQLSIEWDVADLYVLFAPSECTKGTDGYWSNLEGWTTFDEVSVFTQEQIGSFQIPVALGRDALWLTVPAAIERLNKAA